MKKYVIILSVLSFAITNYMFSQTAIQKFETAKELNDKHNFAEAIIILEDLVANELENDEYFQELAYTYFNLLDFDKASEYYKKAIELNKNCLICYANYSRAQYEKENFEKAESIANEGLELDANYSLLYMTRGLIYLATNRKELALSDFNKSIELDPDEDDYYITRTNYYIQTYELYNAYSDVTKAITLKPQNPQYYYYRAYILTTLKVHDEAIIDINKAIELSSNNVSYYNLKSTILMNWGKYEEAEKVLYKSLELVPDDYNAYFALSEVYLALNSFDRYCEVVDNAIDLCPTSELQNIEELKSWKNKYCFNDKLSYYTSRAFAYYIENDYGNAINISKQGVQKLGASILLYDVIGSSYLARKEYDLAKNYFDSCMNINEFIVKEVSECYGLNISPQNAEIIAQTYLIRAEFGLAIIFLTKNDYKSAFLHIMNVINKAEKLENFDNLDLLYITKGLIYLGQKDLANAEAAFKIAREKNLYNPIPRVNLAMVDVFKITNFKIKKLKFEYEGVISCSRLVIPEVKLPKNFDLELLEPALEMCTFAAEMTPQNPVPWLYLAKILQLKGDPDYCKAAQNARDYGLYDSFKEIKADCK
ncbi:MAG TPA: tetratricopeptide repeat protein [Bacteroidales bacterium]|nr:tetratricopeptide repeat protein [Bacteroidales bacterium]HQB21609.1 tetratricopeptide repeat protein [Bacteroidales bacterium]